MSTPARPEPGSYQSFQVWLGGTAPAPTVVARFGAGGLTQRPLDLAGWATVQRWLGAWQAGETDIGTARALGQGLFGLLFIPELRDLYNTSAGQLAAAGQRLRLLLQIDVPALAALPWELLCHTQDDEFLAVESQVSIARYLPRPFRPEPPARPGPLRVLAVFAGPEDQPELGLAGELALVVGAFQGLDPAHAVLDLLVGEAVARASGLAGGCKGPPTAEALTAAIAEGYDVLHYAGHAGVAPDGGGVLVLETAGRTTDLFDSANLAVAAGGSRLRLAVLAACETGAPSASGGPLRAPLPVAQSLVRAGLSAAVAMQAPLPDRAAIAFSRGLYRDLARNAPLDAAIGGARKAMFNLRRGGTDWSIPVLFTQDLGDGRLWQVPVASAAAPELAGGVPALERAGDSRRGIFIEGSNTVSFQDKILTGDIHAQAQNFSLGDQYNAGAGPPAAPLPAADLEQQLAAAFDPLLEAIDDDAWLERARELYALLRAPAPDWKQIAALQKAFAAQPALAAASATLFTNPTVQAISKAARQRFLKS
ncbi:MAG TPA: CHAT domain-containing protein [Chloroflexia bacterium]|nr:CHAT domain-containing protein [Chloroflexia bacterium]